MHAIPNQRHAEDMELDMARQIRDSLHLHLLPLSLSSLNSHYLIFQSLHLRLAPFASAHLPFRNTSGQQSVVFSRSLASETPSAFRPRAVSAEPQEMDATSKARRANIIHKAATFTDMHLHSNHHRCRPYLQDVLKPPAQSLSSCETTLPSF